MNCNIIIDVYEEIKQPLYETFKTSIKEGVFPDLLKIAKVTPIFKSDDTSSLGNYRPISVLPVFSKILERIMYNRTYNYLRKNDLLFDRQFGFQKNTSTEHAILQLVDDITKSFSKREFTLGVFIDLSKAFDTVDHNILLQKLKYYGITGKTRQWFKSYLSNRKQYITFDNGKNTTLRRITCGVPQGSILGPLLFLIYVNDLYNASSKMLPVMFADDTNLFLSDMDIPRLFLKMNKELEKVSLWFKSNKLSLNAKKTKFSFFHATNKKQNVPISLPSLRIDNTEIKRDTVTKFLGILIDENLTWEYQIQNINTKICKSIGILYKSRHILGKHLMKQFYYSFIHSYLSYGNIAWSSTNKTKLMPLYRSQKHAVRVITFKDRLTHSKPIFEKLKILNIFEINIFQILCFMFKCKLKIAPRIFHNLYTLKPRNKYTMRSNSTLIEPICKTKFAQFAISFRAPRLWNELILPTLNITETLNCLYFKNKVKEVLPNESIEKYF